MTPLCEGTDQVLETQWGFPENGIKALTGTEITEVFQQIWISRYIIYTCCIVGFNSQNIDEKRISISSDKLITPN